MSDEVRVWLVEREYDDKGLLRLVYATPDGEQALRMERSPHFRRETTAAVTAAPDRLSRVDNESTRKRYAAEAGRMADEHDPGDGV